MNFMKFSPRPTLCLRESSFRKRARLRHGSRAGTSSAPTAKQSQHSPHRTECWDCESELAARSLPRAADLKVCAASERRRQSIGTLEGRGRTNVLSAWNVVPSSAATGLSPVVHPPSRPIDLQSPQRTSVETKKEYIGYAFSVVC